MHSFQDQTLGSHVVAFARKLSTGSSRELPPSYSKVDLTSVGLTLNDHLNPPPTYDRLIAMLESGEITSVPIHLHPEVERRMSLASTSVTSSRKSSRKSSRNSSIGKEMLKLGFSRLRTVGQSGIKSRFEKSFLILASKIRHFFSYLCHEVHKQGKAFFIY